MSAIKYESPFSLLHQREGGPIEVLTKWKGRGETQSNFNAGLQITYRQNCVAYTKDLSDLGLNFVQYSHILMSEVPPDGTVMDIPFMCLPNFVCVE